MTDPTPLALHGVSLSRLGKEYDLTLVGLDRPVKFLALVRAERLGIEETLTYVTSEEYFGAFVNGDHEAALVESRFLDRERLGGKSVLVVPDYSAEETFFKIHSALTLGGHTDTVEAHRGVGTRVAKAAVVMESVWLGDEVIVEPGAVIYPNTMIANGSVIQANATIGGDGFQVKTLAGRLALIPHSGGVFVATDVAIGSSTCIDRGLFGTFTHIGPGTKVDNLVHIAHNVRVGGNSAVVAGAEISGSAVLGNGVWFGPQACCNPEVRLGDSAFVGTGSVVVRDVPGFTLVAGSPARVMGNVCRCRTKIDLSSGSAECVRCGTNLYVDGETGAVGVSE